MVPKTDAKLRLTHRYPNGSATFEGVNENSSVSLSVNADGRKHLHEVVGFCGFWVKAAWAGGDECSFPGSPHGDRIIKRIRTLNSKDAAAIEDRVPVRVAEPAQERRSEPAEERRPEQPGTELPITRIPNDWDAGWTTREF